MQKTATEADEEYRREVAAYVQTVQKAKSWKSIAEMARKTGLDRSTLSRAFGGKRTTEYPKLLQISRRTGISIPENLEAAASKLAETNPPASLQREPKVIAAVQNLRELRRTDPEAFKAAMRELIDYGVEPTQEWVGDGSEIREMDK